MITHCPQCATRFRVTPEQLAARQGMVRCGQCRTVFNGFEHLGREIRHEAATSLTTGAVAAGASEPSQPDTPLIADHLTGHVDVPAPIPNWSPAPDSVAAAPQEEVETSKKAVFHLLRGYIHADPPAPVWTPAIDASKAEAPAAAPESPSDEALEAFSASLDSPETETSETAPALEQAAVAELLDEPDGASIAPIVNDGTYPPVLADWPKPKRAGLAAAAILLVMALFIQAVFLFRSEIAANWPETKLQLLAACGLLDCRVPLPRQIDNLNIEASELQADTVRANVVQVTAILRNRGATIQAYPTLEITFTDTLDRPVARRSLEASDYLTQKPGKDEGIAAAGEAIAKAAIETVDLKPSGYRLRLYYR